MKTTKLFVSMSLALAFVFISGIGYDTSAQGRGGGQGGGRSAGAGPSTGGPGVDRGIGNASTRSNGRSDEGLNNAATRSKGRSTAGLERARLARSRANALSDKELNRYRGLSRKLGTTPEAMRSAYQAALLSNPDLNYGQFVAANVISDNLGRRFPSITSSAILAGLEDGDSIGETLRNLGMTKEQVKIIQRDAEDKIKAAKRRNQ